MGWHRLGSTGILYVSESPWGGSSPGGAVGMQGHDLNLSLWPVPCPPHFQGRGSEDDQDLSWGLENLDRCVGLFPSTQNTMRCSGWLGRWWAPCLWRGRAEAGRPAPGASGIERVCLGKGSAGPGFSLGSNFLLGDLGQVVWGGLRWRRHEHVLYPCSWWRPRHLAGGCWPARNPPPPEMLSVALEPPGDPSHWHRCGQSAQC